jgi:tRNA threonylcarbamoyladenosine modification (KEOPS) complex  Pcc1 subunit
MNYIAEIKIKEDPGKIYDHLLPETKGKRERSHFTLRKTDTEVIIEVKAKDAVAFRATMNSITQLLAVFQKVKRI